MLSALQLDSIATEVGRQISDHGYKGEVPILIRDSSDALRHVSTISVVYAEIEGALRIAAVVLASGERSTAVIKGPIA